MRKVKLKPPFDALQILIEIVLAGCCAAVLIPVLLAVGKSIGQ